MLAELLKVGPSAMICVPGLSGAPPKFAGSAGKATSHSPATRNVLPL